MEFHVKETMSKGLKMTVDETIDVSTLFQGRNDVVNTGPLHVSLQVAGNEGAITVSGNLTIDWQLACSRCLEPVKEHTIIPFFEKFEPASESDKAVGYEKEGDVIAVKEENLDLKPYVEEALQLYMPFAPLCSDDCKGLCQTCGQNLNDHKCGCSTDRIDPRLAVLKDLFKEQ